MRNLAQDAAYEAAREVIVAGAHASEAIQVATDMLQLFGINSPQATVSPTTITPTTEEVAVTVSFPMQTITVFGDTFLSGLTLTGQCQLQREGFQDLSSTPPPPPGAMIMMTVRWKDEIHTLGFVQEDCPEK